MQRYREVHDFWHVIVGMSVSVEAELALKWFEFAATGMPVALISGVFGPLRLNSAQRERLFHVYVPWAIRNAGKGKYPMNIYYEEMWATTIDDVRMQIGIDPPPSL